LNSTTNEWQQYAAFGVLSLAVAALTGILLMSRDTITKSFLGIVPGNPAGFFPPFIGSIHPLLAFALVAVVGVASLGLLHSRGWFEIYTMKGSLQGVVVAAIIATLFGIEIVFAEITNIIRMPADMNVPPPWSLLFYPIIAYAVEILFHVLPLALLLAVLDSLFKKMNMPDLIWLCIFVISLLEPTYQIMGKSFSWAQAYVALHVFAINFFQLYIFRLYDFISMYSFRIIYYMYWHIIWGYLRLQWLGW